MRHIPALLLLIALLAGCSKSKDRISDSTPPDQTGAMSRVDFKEKISESETVRCVKVTDSEGSKFRSEFRSPGNPEFDQLLPMLDYEHSVIGIEPPILPDGEIQHARLELKFKERLGDFLLVAVDSVEFNRTWKKITIVEREHGDLTLVTETMLADGLLDVHVEAENGHEFRLKESKLKVVYYKPEECGE